ncbi:MAG: metal ABC transporter permease [Trueperaceae bacterium]|nr:metal ABC transporter permease [Trueperaceae bacterium]
MLELFSDFTLRNVAMGAALLGISSGVLGSFALLREQSLLGDTLSHAALPGVCLGFLIAGGRNLLPILLGALVTGALAALFVLLLTRRSRLKNDAALGIALSLFFAVGTVLLTYIGNQNNAGQAGLDAFLFGQAASILPADVAVMAVITALSLALVLGFWKEFKLLSFDPGFAGSLGLPTLLLDIIMTVMIALAIVIGLQLVGVVLMAAMVIAPAAAARQWTRRLGAMVTLAAVFGALSGVVGAVISALATGLATGPVIVLCASVFVIVSLLFAPERGLLWAALRSVRQRRELHSHQVLIDLYQLADAHGNPQYPSEAGMMNLYYGTDARRALRKLASKGYLVKTEHMREEGPHWVLTDAGYERARELLGEMGLAA